MWRWRIGVGVVLMALLGAPLLVPLARAVSDPAGWSAWRDAPRQLALARTTAQLVAIVLALTLPIGTVLAVLLYRSDLPGRAKLRRLVVVALFVPLPLFASAWQSVLGSGGWLGPSGEWRPWLTGLGAAAWVHAMAGLPWVVWLIGQGLCWVERSTEEDALLATGRLSVLLRVTLPRARGAVLAAAAWVALQTANEITVTDMMQVRTFAEEVYTQFVLPDLNKAPTPELAVSRAVSVALPGVFIVGVLLVVAVLRWERSVPPLATEPDARPLLQLGRWRWLWLAGVVAFWVSYAGVPIGSLVDKLGRTGTAEWSPASAGHYLVLAARAHALMIAESLAGALAVGALATALAVTACWLARNGWGYRLGLALLVAAPWAMPGTVVCFGLMTTIGWLVDAEQAMGGSGILAKVLYYGPSQVPVLWADLLRLFPFAVALVWPAVRLVPGGLVDAVRIDGASPAGELRHAIWPQSAAAAGRATAAVAILALGEISASKLVATPGGQTFAHEVFTRMHYGINSQLAAMCLLLLAMTGVLLIPVRRGRPRHPD